MPTIRRTIKNVVWNYSDAQIKVREATSNDPWGPSSTLMSEIADLTYNVVAFTEIMQMIWKRLNDHGKNWRHVYKSLVLLDYIIKTGSEKVAQQCKENVYAIQTLKDFQYTEDNKDQGMNVREKAKQLVSLLKDDERLRNERAKALKAKERFAQNAMGIGSNNKIQYETGSPNLPHEGFSDTHVGATGYNDNSPTQRRRLSSDLESARPSSLGEEELQLQLALAMSKEEHEEELKKQKNDDIKLAMAIEQSKQDNSDEPGTQSGNRLADSFETGTMNANHGTTTDPWGVPLPQTASMSDPWGGAGAGSSMSSPRAGRRETTTTTTASAWESPVALNPSSNLQARAQTPITTDPWGVPISSPERSTPQSISTPSSQPQPATTPQSPWEPSTVPATGQTPVHTMPNTLIVTSTGTSVTTTNGMGTSSIDDAFDMLVNRKASTSPALSIEETSTALDGFGPQVAGGGKLNMGSGTPTSDPWLMSGVGKDLPDQEQNKKKTPKDFLGENAALVNLDNLVSKTSPSLPKEMNAARDPNQLKNDNKYSQLSRTSPSIFEGTNPFTGSGTNPFEQSTARVPLRQMQQSQQQSFTSVNNADVLPRPLIPFNTPLQPGIQQPNQPSNPFL
ncbi:epsin-2 isoform X3 [Octopus bimaculoides]|uniref:epsin-2 isoform X3 n=1 Tax=Octopus bimaculoides TaxID=37653 RepID=UPI00071CF76F|nr:epsin-2 isoform X3 [Octopus bimaculoides]|eukprot:XP_014788046.1 PREDICTED: epsin-2-like isoform X3 [Octopus bimaculoides]